MSEQNRLCPQMTAQPEPMRAAVANGDGPLTVTVMQSVEPAAPSGVLTVSGDIDLDTAPLLWSALLRALLQPASVTLGIEIISSDVLAFVSRWEALARAP